MENVLEILESLVVMINAEKFLNELHEAKFEQILGILKVPAFGESRQKIDIIAAQMATVGQIVPELNGEADEDEEDEEEKKEEAKPAKVEEIVDEDEKLLAELQQEQASGNYTKIDELD